MSGDPSSAGELSPDGHVSLRGWAADINPGASIKEVQFLSNRKQVAVVVPGEERSDIAAHFQRPAILNCGWTCNLPRATARSIDVIEIQAVNDKNVSRVIAYDFLKTMVSHGRVAG